VPSLRLKACRRGQQDVEYLWLLARQRGLDRRQAAALAADALALSAERRALDQHGAQFEQVANADYARLDALRRAVAAALGRY
jgi:hypothetical protein